MRSHEWLVVKIDLMRGVGIHKHIVSVRTDRVKRIHRLFIIAQQASHYELPQHTIYAHVLACRLTDMYIEKHGC